MRASLVGFSDSSLQISVQRVSGKLKGLFGVGSSSTDEATESSENTPPRETDTDTTASSSSSASDSAAPSASANATAEKKAVSKEDTITLKITTTFPVIPPMTAEEKRKARSRYATIQ